MRIAIIGGTGFIGSRVVHLLAPQHEILLFHRGRTAAEVPAGIRRLIGRREDLPLYSSELARFAPDVVLDVICYTEAQARTTVETFRSIAGRLVMLSSMDVYRAYEVQLRQTNGPLQPVPLTEESALRTTLYPFRGRNVKVPYSGIDVESYDKILVERVAAREPSLPATVLRLPMVYGPGDPGHRFFPWIKRMYDGRPAILMDPDMYAWRGTWGYVDNVAAAIALACTDARAAGATYNVAEPNTPTYGELAAQVGHAVGWNGRVQVLPFERLPAHLRVPSRMDQHWAPDTTRIRRELGYHEIVARPEALSRTVAWERVHPPADLPAAAFDYPAEDAALAGRSRAANWGQAT